MNARWLPRSLAVRVTLLCAAIAVAITGMLGANFFFGARRAILAHADEQLIGRAERFRRLAGDARTIEDLRDRSMLFEAMLGTASDVLILRRAGEAPLVEVNPDRLLPPACAAPVAADRAIGARDVCHAGGSGGSGESGASGGIGESGDAPMRWVAGLARAGHDGAVIEVVAGHPLVSEAQMISTSRRQVLVSTVLAVLASTGLVYLVLRHGLRPLNRIAAQAARIEPINLALRLPEHDAPLELQRMVAVFNAMLDRIATGYERLSQFSADLAHEIRTPVGALIGQTQVALNRTRSAGEYQQVLESNLEELNRLRMIVDNILFLAQADHAALEIEREKLAIEGELRNIAEYFEGLADEAGLRLEVQASGSARVNPALCRRALHNLVVNAVRYGTPGTTVRLIGAQDGEGSTIAVENNGTPIPAEQLARLFDRFYRAEPARQRPGESSGLGLAIVKAIMDLHGGRASAACSPEGAFRFELRFRA